jgi:triacylglycerol lipase
MGQGREIPDSIAELRVPNPRRTYFEDGVQVPFRPQERAFRLAHAWWLLEASFLAYLLSHEDIRERMREQGFAHCRIVERGDIRALLTWNEAVAFLLFRGTLITSRRNLVTDLDVRLVRHEGGPGRVHAGFREAYRSVDDEIAKVVSELPDRLPLFLAGHSLGGALAVLASARIERETTLYTFGAPRIGDAEFVGALSPRPRYRVINEHDIVCQMPPSPPFRHVGDAHLVTKDAEHLVGAAAELSFADRLRRNMQGRIPGLLGQVGRGRAFRRELMQENVISDHAPASYSARIWNALMAP